MMKKISYYLVGLGFIVIAASCERNDPIADLGTTNGQYSAQLTVTYNKTIAPLGDSVVVTASSWQRDDKYKNVTFYETVYETFGINLQLLNGTAVNTKIVSETAGASYATLLLTDTIKPRAAWKTVAAADMDQYWVTVSNNYVIPGVYHLRKADGKYPNSSALINALPNNEFEVLKSILAYNITKADFDALFPGSPSTYFTSGGTYVLSQAGINFLKANLTKAQLTTVVKSLAKTGIYSIKLDTEAVTPTGATTSRTRTFDNNL